MFKRQNLRQTNAEKENEFYTNGTNNGTINQKRPSIINMFPKAQPAPATTKLDTEIAQTKDELASNSNISEYKKGLLKDRLTKLLADKNVIDWKQKLNHTPSVEDYDAMERQAGLYFQYAQDEYANAIGSGTVKPGSERSYVLQAKLDKLEEIANALSRGKMGVIDGERAESRDTIPSSMKTGIIRDSTDGNEQKTDRSTERRYDDETLELCSNIKKYLLDQANPDMPIEEFQGLYPYGTQQMQMWTDQLKVKMGEDAAGMFINKCVKDAEEKPERRYDDETLELCSNIKKYLLDQANPDMPIEEFRGLYPYGTQQMQMWTDQLKVKMGEDAAGMFISDCKSKAEANTREDYPPEPSPSPMPGPPPNTEDMQEYEEELKNYWALKEDWDNEVARIDLHNAKIDVPASFKNLIENDEIEEFWLKDTAKKVLEETNIGQFSGERDVYEFKIDNKTVVFEVMDERRLGIYGGEFTTDQGVVLAVMNEVIPISNVFELFTATAQLLDPDYNPGAILEPGDVRINIGVGKDYFFRDGEFLYAQKYGLSDVVWGEYGKQLNDEYRESGKNWGKLFRAIPFVDLLRALD